MRQAGKLIDASFVDVPGQRNQRKENEEIKSGKMPEIFEHLEVFYNRATPLDPQLSVSD